MLTAVIPARIGSKRILKKNIKKFFGKPIIYYSIKAALKSKLFKEVVVSTDSKEIRSIAISFGAKCNFLRPKNLSGDNVGTAPVLFHAIKELNIKSDFFCCIYATAPLIDYKDLIKSYNQIKKHKSDACFSVTSFNFPIQRSMRMDRFLNLKFNFPKNMNSRSQNLRKNYHDAGQFYWFKTKSFLKNKSMCPKRSIGFELPSHRVQDIDNEEDWNIAKAKFSFLR